MSGLYSKDNRDIQKGSSRGLTGSIFRKVLRVFSVEDVWKLARSEAWRSVSDQFRTEMMMGQRSIWGDGHGQKGLEPTHTW